VEKAGNEFDPIRTRASLLNAILDARNDVAWRRFVEQYTPLIFRWCNGLSRDEKEEIRSAVLDQVFRSIRDGFRYDPAKRFRAWLKTVVTNKIRDLRRKQREEPLNWQDIDVDGLVTELDDTVSRDIAFLYDAMAKVQKRVNETTWKSFYLTHFEGRSAPDVGSMLGIKVGTVYQHKKRVIDMLRKELVGPAQLENPK
jgi:RNA polymerase sigma-70 factor (ECF subfamily)